MKNEGELIRALADGEKVRIRGWDKHEYIHIVDGEIVDGTGIKCGFYLEADEAYKDYEIYQEPVWCDNIPEGVDILCVCKSGHLDWFDLIYKYIEGDPHPYRGTSGAYEKATPLTKKEILKLADNAPE